MRYSTSDLHLKQKNILDAADQGDEVIIYRRGRDYKLTPLGPTPLSFPTEISDL